MNNVKLPPVWQLPLVSLMAFLHPELVPFIQQVFDAAAALKLPILSYEQFKKFLGMFQPHLRDLSESIQEAFAEAPDLAREIGIDPDLLEVVIRKDAELVKGQEASAQVRTGSQNGLLLLRGAESESLRRVFGTVDEVAAQLDQGPAVGAGDALRLDFKDARDLFGKEAQRAADNRNKDRKVKKAVKQRKQQADQKQKKVRARNNLRAKAPQILG